MNEKEDAGNGPYTVVLVGSGAVRGAWDPIVEAVQSVYEQVASSDQANTALANIVYNLRWWHFAQRKELDGLGTVTQETRASFAEWYATLEKICTAIAESLARAEDSSTYALRAEFDAVWNLSVGTSGTFKFLTTNWDRLISKRVTALWPELENAVFHVHGDRRDPTTLLLPTEVVFEPHRRPEARHDAQARHFVIMEVLEKAERLFVYGLSLSSEDAELTQVIAVGLDESSVERIEIIDPEHERVAHRLMAVLHKRRPSIFGRTPDQLAGPIAHAWR